MMEQTFSVYRKINQSPKVAVHGQVHTKPHIVELMLDLVGYSGDAGTKMLDPGCGDGAFTVAAARRLIQTHGVPQAADNFADCILAIDQDRHAVEACREGVITTLSNAGTSKSLAFQLAKSWVGASDCRREDILAA